LAHVAVHSDKQECINVPSGTKMTAVAQSGLFYGP